MTLKDNVKIMIAECTEEQYELFKKTIEKLYPGLCEFDVEQCIGIKHEMVS